MHFKTLSLPRHLDSVATCLYWPLLSPIINSYIFNLYQAATCSEQPPITNLISHHGKNLPGTASSRKINVKFEFQPCSLDPTGQHKACCFGPSLSCSHLHYSFLLLSNSWSYNRDIGSWLIFVGIQSTVCFDCIWTLYLKNNRVHNSVPHRTRYRAKKGKCS